MRNCSTVVILGRTITKPLLVKMEQNFPDMAMIPVFVVHNDEEIASFVIHNISWDERVVLKEICIPSEMISSPLDIVEIIKEHESAVPACALINKSTFERVFKNSEDLFIVSAVRDWLDETYVPLFIDMGIKNSVIFSLDNDKSIAAKAGEALADIGIDVYPVVSHVFMPKNPNPYIINSGRDCSFFFPPEAKKVFQSFGLSLLRPSPYIVIAPDKETFDRCIDYKNCINAAHSGMCLEAFLRHGFSIETAQARWKDFDDVLEIVDCGKALVRELLNERLTTRNFHEIYLWENYGENFLDDMVSKRDTVGRGLSFDAASAAKLKRHFKLIGEYKGHKVDYYLEKIRPKKATVFFTDGSHILHKGDNPE